MYPDSQLILFMADRKTFIKTATALTAVLAICKGNMFAKGFFDLETKRPPLADRHFTSPAVETMITEIKGSLKTKNWRWLFENCFPNTLDTTVDFEMSKRQAGYLCYYRRY